MFKGKYIWENSRLNRGCIELEESLGDVRRGRQKEIPWRRIFDVRTTGRIIMSWQREHGRSLGTQQFVVCVRDRESGFTFIRGNVVVWPWSSASLFFPRFYAVHRLRFRTQNVTAKTLFPRETSGDKKRLVPCFTDNSGQLVTTRYYSYFIRGLFVVLEFY